MALHSLTVRGFRNLGDTALELSPQLTLLVGNNGQGKTNALEAIHVAMTGASFRSASDQDMVGWSRDFAAVTAVLKSPPSGLVTLTHKVTKIPPHKKHQGQIFPVVIFSPDDVQLSKGSPKGRRRFLDWLLASVDPRYLRLYRQYHRALLQRNRVIKDARLWPTLPDFTQVLSESGLYLWQRRREIVTQIVPGAREIFAQLTGLTLDCALKEGGSPGSISTVQSYQDLLEARRSDERIRQTTLVGPHRDDLTLTINHVAAADYASQGQHRAIALSLKLASYHMLEKETGLMPLVLLDDVLSELDPQKRSRLLAFIASSHPQTIVTDTEARNFENLEPWIYTVDQGLFTRRV